MPKLTSLFRLALVDLLLLLIISLLTTPLSTVQAQAPGIPNCRNPNVQIAPDPLLSNSPQGTFTIDVGNNNEPGVTEWKMEFKCGARHQISPTRRTPGSTSNIETILPNSGTADNRCEFDPRNNPIKVQVKAVVNNNDVDWCVASYTVTNADNQCKLNLRTVPPGSGITPATTIFVDGSDLTPGGRFVIFVDDDAVDIDNRAQIDLPGWGNVQTPSFTNYQIPTRYLTPNLHTVSLRMRNNDRDFYNPLKNEASFYGPPLCQTSFTVGTAGSPGGTLPPAHTPAGPKGSPLVGTPQTCPDGPSVIQTAIGCVHTEPGLFLKDFLTFVISLAGTIAFLLMLFGAFQMITSAGNPDNLKTGQELFTNAIIGLLFIAFSVLLMQIIGVDILNLPGLRK